MQKYVLILGIFLLTLSISRAQFGNFDNSFGIGGKVILDVFGLSDAANDVAIQSDEKLVVAGSCLNASGKTDFCVCRLLPDGALDNTFGNNGKTAINIQSTDFNDVANEVHIQSDGKIVLVGQTDNKYFVAVRLLPDGTLDSGYGTGGKMFFGFSGNQGSVCYHSVMQSDDKVVMAGMGNLQSVNFNLTFARLNTDGSLDTDFSNDGKLVITPPIAGYNYIYSICIDNMGNFYGAGRNTNGKPLVVKIDTNGNLVPTFGTNGIASYDSISGDCRAIAVAPNGRIIAAGRSYKTGFDGFLMAFDSNGKIDSTFGTNGHISYDMDGNSEDQIFDILIQNDEKILAVGSTYSAGVGYMLVNRFLPNGGFDNTFSGDGIKLINVSTNSSGAEGLLLQPDGKLVIAGLKDAPLDDFAIVRLLMDNNSSIEYLAAYPLNIYPNPAQNTLMVKGEEGHTFVYRMLNVQGQVIQSATAHFNHAIDIQSIPIGNYFMVVQEKGSSPSVYHWVKAVER